MYLFLTLACTAVIVASCPLSATQEDEAECSVVQDIAPALATCTSLLDDPFGMAAARMRAQARRLNPGDRVGYSYRGTAASPAPLGSRRCRAPSAPEPIEARAD
jgi:hypothetical protein